MFAATPVFRNEGAIYRNGEISEFPKPSCSGTGSVLPPAPTTAPAQPGQHVIPQTSRKNLYIFPFYLNTEYLGDQAISTASPAAGLAREMGINHLPGTETPVAGLEPTGTGQRTPLSRFPAQDPQSKITLLSFFCLFHESGKHLT